MYKCCLKRIVDIVISILGLAIASPLIIATIALLYFTNKGAGVFFIQQRPGKDARLFNILKFKTMTDECDEKGNLLPVSKRITNTGKIVRALSIDELPQLYNVLKGDMSLIGPRPLLVQYLPLYSKEQMRRHEVRPGITGWAQTHGRNSITWAKKFEYDLWYVDNYNFWIDLTIIFLTLKKVIIREGVNSKEAATMPTFTGNN